MARNDGWNTHRLNCSAGIYSTPGWPDSYWTHQKHGYRWVEYKVPGGSLEISQIEMFGAFAKANINVFVLCKIEDYPLIYQSPNWWKFAMKGKIR